VESVVYLEEMKKKGISHEIDELKIQRQNSLESFTRKLHLCLKGSAPGNIIARRWSTILTTDSSLANMAKKKSMNSAEVRSSLYLRGTYPVRWFLLSCAAKLGPECLFHLSKPLGLGLGRLELPQDMPFCSSTS
jgi:hypothetical protein